MTIRRSGTSSGPNLWVFAGLAQLALLLLGFWPFLHPLSHINYGWATAMVGLSLAPIGLGLRRPWLSFGALAWCAVGLVTCPLYPERAECYVGGSMVKSALLLASAAAGAGQWINLNQLPLARFGQRIRWITKATIAGSLLLLLNGFTIGILGFLSDTVLLLLVLANLSLTALTLLLAFRRGLEDLEPEA